MSLCELYTADARRVVCGHVVWPSPRGLAVWHSLLSATTTPRYMVHCDLAVFCVHVYRSVMLLCT